MNDLLQQLLTMGPALGAGVSGHGNNMAAFMEGYQRTMAQLQQQQRLKQQDQIAAEDRQRQIERQTTADANVAADRARAGEVQKQQDFINSQKAASGLTETAAGFDDPMLAKSYIESQMPNLMSVFGQHAMALGQPAVEQAQQVITGRQKKQVSDFVESALKVDHIVNNPDADPEIQLPEHIAKIMGVPSARLSALQQKASLPVGKPAKPPSAEVSMQSETRMVGGKPTVVNYNPKAGTYTDQAGKAIIVDPVPEKPNAGDEPISPDDVSGAAQAILAGRMAPSQLSLVGGMGNRGVKFKQAVVTEVNRQNPSFNWQQAEAGFQYGKSPGTQTTVRYLDNVAKTIPMLRAANQTFKRSGVRFINDIIKSGKSQFGNVDVADFDFKNTLLADEIAKVLQGGGTGSGTSDAKLRQAQELLSGNMTPQQFDAVLDAAEDMLSVRKQTLTQGTFMEQPAAPKFKVGQKVRNKKTGEIREVTGVRPDGSPILGPVKQ